MSLERWPERWSSEYRGRGLARGRRGGRRFYSSFVSVCKKRGRVRLTRDAARRLGQMPSRETQPCSQCRPQSNESRCACSQWSCSDRHGHRRSLCWRRERSSIDRKGAGKSGRGELVGWHSILDLQAKVGSCRAHQDGGPWYGSAQSETMVSQRVWFMNRAAGGHTVPLLGGKSEADG